MCFHMFPPFAAAPHRFLTHRGVMNAYAGNGDEICCMRIFQEMCQQQLDPTMTTYSIMMKPFGCRIGLLRVVTIWL